MVVAVDLPAGNTLTQPAAVTDSNGQTTATLASTVAGVKTVSATINGVAVTQTAAVTFNYNTLAISAVVGGDQQYVLFHGEAPLTASSWVYCNTPSITSSTKMYILATVSVTPAVVGGEAYTVSFTEDGHAVTNFIITTTATANVYRVQPVLQSVAVLGNHTLGIQYVGATSGQTATTTATVNLLRLGDITGNGSFNTLDKNAMNLRVLNQATGYPERRFDLNGSGTFNTLDKNAMNLVVLGQL